MVAERSAAVTAPTRLVGGAMSTRATIPGAPRSSKTRASPTASSVIAVAVSKVGLARKVSAAARTAFWSLGVKARKACCTRFPSCPKTTSGKS